MTIASPRATNGRGGLIYVALSSASGNINLQSPIVTSAQAGQHGGLIYFTGVNLDLTATSVSLTTMTVPSGYNGGGLYISNSGYTNILINTGTIATPTAGLNGGFLYKTGGTTYSIDLR